MREIMPSVADDSRLASALRNCFGSGRERVDSHLEGTATRATIVISNSV
jgi:hypothetical protein